MRAWMTGAVMVDVHASYTMAPNLLAAVGVHRLSTPLSGASSELVCV